MKSVYLLKANKAWEHFFIEEPLTLEEFVQTSSTLPKYIFPFISETITDLSNNPVSEIYLQTCLGTGKSTLSSIIAAYTIYLFCITKEPNKLWGFAPSATFSYCVLGTRKTAELAVHSLVSVLEQIPMFKKTKSHNDAEGPICYNLNKPNKLIEAYYVSSNGSTGVPLSIIPVQSSADLLGTTIIGALLTETQSFMDSTKVSSEDMYLLIHKIKCRIDSRFGPRDEFIHRMLVEKEPNDVEDDVLDAYIRSDAILRDVNKKVITLKPRWELFPQDFDMSECLYMDLYSEKVLVSPNKNTVAFPVSLKDTALSSPKSFIRDFIGLPTSTIENPRKSELKRLYSNLLSSDVKIIMENGIFYLKDRKSDIAVCISDLFR